MDTANDSVTPIDIVQFPPAGWPVAGAIHVDGHVVRVDRDTQAAYCWRGATVWSSIGYALGHVRPVWVDGEQRYASRCPDDYAVHGTVSADELEITCDTLAEALSRLVRLATVN